MYPRKIKSLIFVFYKISLQASYRAETLTSDKSRVPHLLAMFFFTSHATSPPSLIYMGKDKHENEELIKYGWPEDLWFHVSKHSSAHVYLRCQKGEAIDEVPDEIIAECAQLREAYDELREASARLQEEFVQRGRLLQPVGAGIIATGEEMQQTPIGDSSCSPKPSELLRM